MRFLTARLQRNLGLSPELAAMVVDDVFDALDQTVDDFIADRHAELQRAGWKNAAIYDQVMKELADWRFKAPKLTERQIRRRIYG